MGEGSIGRFKYISKKMLSCRNAFYFSQEESVSEEMIKSLSSMGTNSQVLDCCEDNLFIYQIGDCAVSLSYAGKDASIEVYNKDLNKRNKSISKLEVMFA